MYKILHIPTSTFLYTRKEYLNILDMIVPTIWCEEELDKIRKGYGDRYITETFSIIRSNNKKICNHVLNNLKNNRFPDDDLYQNLLNYEIIKME